MDASRSLTPEERRRALGQIAAEVAVCTRCPLSAQRTKAVPGEGDPNTEVVLVGEGPGYNEDREGRPFVGQAGGLLNELLTKIGWRRRDVFITNVVKCRPPGNRDPEPAEIAACAPFLKRQMEVLDPAVVVTLGRHSLQTFMPGARISQAHGTTSAAPPETGAHNATTYALYHPAAALRQHSLKETMLVDMCGLPDVLIEARERRASAVAGIGRVAGKGGDAEGGADAGIRGDADRGADAGIAAITGIAAAPGRVVAAELVAEPSPVARPQPAVVAVSVQAPGPEHLVDPVAVIATGPTDPQLELFG